MIGIVGDAWFWLFAIVATAVSLCVAAQRFLRRAWPRALLLGATNGLCVAYAGVLVPLTFGLSITQLPVQVVVGACVLVGRVVGWFVPMRCTLPLVVVASGLASFAATLQAIALLYPPKLTG